MNAFPETLINVLQRLIDNAIVHGFAQRNYGLIHIRCQLIDNNNARILVSDDGIGIAEKYKAKVFDPFFTTRLGYGTSGLGLHIAHNAVTQILGGNLTVVNHQGEGSEFAINLPLLAPY